MKKRFALLVVALAMLALPALAQAEVPHGFYVGLQGGLNWKMDRDFFGWDGSWINYEYPIDYKMGWAAGATLGYGFSGTRNWFAYPRLELEMTWRQNKSEYGYGEAANYTGNITFTSMAAMANLLLDFNLGGRVYPYIGFGLGAVTGWHKDSGIFYPDIQDTVFGYQGKAGLGVAVNNNVSLFAEYTYIRSQQFEQDNNAIGGMNDHSAMVGVRFYFGGKPAPVPAPAPAPVYVPAAPVLVNSYTLFFDHDKYNLDAAANSVIAQAVAEFRNTGSTRIDVTGHTDTTGTSQYNMGLSQRRADAVAAALVTSGIPRSAITIHAVGETQLLVPTADNVRERQNRRVYIYIYN